MPPLTTRNADTWIFASLCLIVVLAPLPLGSNRAWAAQLLQLWIAILATGTAWLLARGRIAPSAALRRGLPAVLLFAAIPAWTLLQLLPLPSTWTPISQDPGASLYKLQKSTAYLLVFLLCLQLLSTPVRLERLAQVIVISGVMQAVYGVLTLTGDGSLDVLGIREMTHHKGDATGTFLNRNHLAGFLEMSLAVGIGLLIAGFSSSDNGTSWRARLRRLLTILLGGKARIRLFLVAMVIGLVMTHSRMGNTAFFASMGISALIGLAIFRKSSRSMVILFVSMVAIDVLIISTWFGLERLVERIENTNLAKEERTDVNAHALPWVQDNWLTGSGAGSFASQFPAYRTAEVGAFFDFAHNDYLQLLGEYGLIGGLLFAGIAVFSLHAAVQAQRRRRNPLLRGMGFAAMMGIISLLIHSSVDFNLHIPANAVLFSMLCALAFVARHQGRDSPADTRHVSRQPPSNKRELHA